MTLQLDIDRKVRGTRKRFFNSITKSKSRFRDGGGGVLPNVHGGRIDSAPWWQIALRSLCLIVLPLLYFGATVATLITPGTRDSVRWGVGSKDYAPLLRPRGRAVEHGIAIVAACRNRQPLLKAALPSWLGVLTVKEIVLVDWDSSPPLSQGIDGIKDERLRIVRVEGEPKWVLSRAYNLAMSVAQSEWIIRVDCDCRLKARFIQAHLGEAAGRKGEFWSGYWQKARDDNEVHLNGAIIVRRSDFWGVGGYDERIQTYGWDDEDLFSRLERSGLKRNALNYDMLDHIPHGDELRVRSAVVLPEVNIDFNSLLLQRLPPWTGVSTRRTERTAISDDVEDVLPLSRYARVHKRDTGPGNLLFQTLSRPPSAADLVLPKERKEAWNLALGRRLHDTYGFCWDLMTEMGVQQRETLMRKLMVEAPNTTHPDEVPRFMMVHVMHGLGNRLRALGSALAFAKRTRRIPVVLWEADRHCGARFDELFETELSDGESIVALSGIGLSWPFSRAAGYDAAWTRWESYNYMQMEGSGAKKDEPILANSSHNIYFKAAYIMQTVPGNLGGWDAANAELRKLRAVRPVRDAVDAVAGALSDSIGVHVRHLDTVADIAAVNANSEYGKDDTAVIDYWRNASAPAAFIAGARAVLAELGQKSEQAPRRVFIAADSAEWAAQLERGLPGMTWTLSGADAALGCSDTDGKGRRSVGCLRRALADLLCLSRTRVVLGSMWSSFSEASARLGAGGLRLAGVDFGAAADETVAAVAKKYGAAVADVVANVRRKRELKRGKGAV